MHVNSSIAEGGLDPKPAPLQSYSNASKFDSMAPVHVVSLVWLSNVDADGAGVRVVFVFGDVNAMCDLRDDLA